MERHNVKQGALQTVEAATPRRAPAGLLSWLITLTTMALLAIAVAAQAQNAPASKTLQTVAGGPARASLLELYTSEGCSSCPPAETWLSKLTSDARVWKDIVPVAFHVDYWDYLGWVDVFARPEYSERQRDYGSSWNAESIYTPAFVNNGAEWMGWRDGKTVPAANAQGGTLSLDILPSASVVRFRPADGKKLRQTPTAFIAVLGMGMTRKITAGENDGQTLTHDFVAMDLQRIPLHQSGDEWLGNGKWQVVKAADPARYAVAVWV